MSTGQIITPAGTVINLTDNLTGTQSPVRAKAIALNPVNHNYAAVLLMGASSAVDVINLSTGTVTQQYVPFKDKSGSFAGISYSSDGAHLLFSQDNSFLAISNRCGGLRRQQDRLRPAEPEQHTASRRSDGGRYQRVCDNEGCAGACGQCAE
jgi:hypothetical protein